MAHLDRASQREPSGAKADHAQPLGSIEQARRDLPPRARVPAVGGQRELARGHQPREFLLPRPALGEHLAHRDREHRQRRGAGRGSPSRSGSMADETSLVAPTRSFMTGSPKRRVAVAIGVT